MIPAASTLLDAVADGRLAHDRDPGLRRHVANVTPHEKPRGVRMSKPRGPTRRIDAVIAAATAAHLAMGPKPETTEPAHACGKRLLVI
jgi:phage terminase large subunit-like protein